MENALERASTQPPPPRRPRRKWPLIGGLAFAFILSVGIGAYLVGATTGVVHAASINTTQTLASSTGTQTPGGTQPPAHGSGMVTCEVLTVSSVSGQTITAKEPDGSAVTILTTSSTQYKQDGKSVTASAITAGTQIRIQGTKNSDGSYTATSIDIV